MIFHNFIGNQDVKDQISHLVDMESVPHTLLLEGPKGSGKRTLAKLIAMALLCGSKDEKPCLACPACKKAQTYSHPDLTLTEGGESSRSFHIDQVRTIRSDAFIIPNESDRKIYVLADIQTMSEQAQNSALKILEEPPSFVTFILTCDSRTNLLPTVVSRAQVFTLSAVNASEAVDFLGRIFPDMSRKSLAEAADVWGGNIGRILEGLENGKLSESVELVKAVANAMIQSGELTLLRLTAKFEKDKALFRTCVPLLGTLFRDASVLHEGVEVYLSGCPEEARGTSSQFTRAQIADMIKVIREIEYGIERNANHSILLTRFCSSLKRAAEY